MRRLLDRVRKEFDAFIEQRDDLVLISCCSFEDQIVALKLVGDLEQSTGTDVFLLFTDNFVESEAFATAAIQRFQKEYQLACDALRGESLPPLPPIPENLNDLSRSAAERLRDAMAFSRSLLPKQGGHRMVWALFPQQIADHDAYHGLISSFIPWDGVKAWMHGLRIIFRDDIELAGSHCFQDAPRSRIARLDLGPDAMAASMADDVDDEALPLDQRMQSLFMVASLDGAHNRELEATSKFDILLGYYQSTGNLMMQALVMNGIADLHHRNQRLEEAQHWYECALPPAVEAQVPVLLATLSKNLGDVAFKLGRYADAEQYYDGWDKLAAHMLDPESKARALGWRGLSQEKQGAYDRAIESWESAALLSRSVEMPVFLRDSLEHLERGYGSVSNDARVAAVKQELTTLRVSEVPA